MNDATDDQIMQNLALACQNFQHRFGEADLIAALEDLIETLEGRAPPEDTPIPQ
jgi:Holliday junction resolvase-like predicted endonuclease